MIDRPALPESCGIAFKEWAGICEALAAGRQSIILRKGGIEDGPGGFAPEHPAFWLYPTAVHQAEQGLKVPAGTDRVGDDGWVTIDALATVESVDRVDDLETLLGLDALHVWTEETIRKRYEYRQPGLWVLGVRVYRLPTPDRVEITPAQLGCKTWVPLESPPSTSGLVPVRDDSEAEGDRARFRELLTMRRAGRRP